MASEPAASGAHGTFAEAAGIDCPLHPVVGHPSVQQE